MMGLLGVISFGIAKIVDAIRPMPVVIQNKKELRNSLQLPAFGSVKLDQLRLLVDNPSIALLDARPVSFFEIGHLPGALSLPRRDLDNDGATANARLREVNQLLAKRGVKRLVVYCSGAECTDSDVVARRLTAEGWKNNQVEVYGGGWAEWKKSGLPVEKNE